MFNTYANLKHTYLHKCLKCTEPAKTNRFLDEVMKLGPTERSLDNLLHTPASLQPASFGLVTDKTKARLAYGRWGIPQLIREIAKEDREMCYQALGTLVDELKDPEKCYRAVHCFDCVMHISELLETKCTDDECDQQIIQRILFALDTIGSHEYGADRILTNPNITKNMYNLLNDNILVQEVAKVFDTIAGHYTIADLMVAADHLNGMRMAIEKHKDLYDLYSAIAYLIERSPNKAFPLGYFEFFESLIIEPTECQPIILKCFALLVQCDQGQIMCDAFQIIPRLLNILNVPADGEYDPIVDWRPKTMTYEYTAMALHNCLISTPSRWLCQQYWDMPLILVRHAHCKNNDRLQVHCLQILRHITEKPSIKRFVGTVCKSRIKRVQCPNERVRHAKSVLLDWLRYRNYQTRSPTTASGCLDANSFYPERKATQQDAADANNNDNINSACHV